MGSPKRPTWVSWLTADSESPTCPELARGAAGGADLAISQNTHTTQTTPHTPYRAALPSTRALALLCAPIALRETASAAPRARLDDARASARRA